MKREPLSLYVRDALLAYARARGFEDMVACVPDSLLEGMRKCVAGSDWNLDAIARELNEADCEESVQEGVLVIRPKSHLHAEALRLDRRPVSGLLKALSARGDTLDTFVAYHAGVANYEQSAARRVLERPIVAYYRLNRNDNWKLPHRLLAVIGKLSSDERRKLFSTGRVPIDSPKYRKDLEWFALFFQPSAQRPPPPGGPGMQVRVVERAQMEGTEFELQPSRVVASSGSRWLQLEDLGSDLLVQRVRKGTDQLEDSEFQSFSSLLETFPGDDLRVWLGKEFDYHWAKDGRWLTKVKIGPRVEIGPFRIRERLGQASKPVPMDRHPVDP
ncbi:hypothetical protein EON81_20735 [bacterium]|nr:MAG: hypothetical protein EON81_20735 [bacterium]